MRILYCFGNNFSENVFKLIPLEVFVQKLGFYDFFYNFVKNMCSCVYIRVGSNFFGITLQLQKGINRHFNYV